MRFVVIMLLAALFVHLLGSLAMRDVPDLRGWRMVKPGPMYRFGIWLGTALTAFMAYVWLFVGSNRPDGAQQMQILGWLILAFGIGTIVVIWQDWLVRRAIMRWRGDQIVWRAEGKEISRRLSDVVAVERSVLGAVKLHFADGANVRVDPNASNAAALIEAVTARGRQ